MKEIGIGKMAELNKVTKKTLRLYQETGILEPVRVDASTGYRYYSLDQCSTLDMIQQLQTIGLTLADIKVFMEDPNKSLLDILTERKHAIEEEMLNLSIARQNIEQLMSNYHLSTRIPLFDTVIMERMPEKTMICFNVFNPHAIEISDDVDTVLEEWELNLRQTKLHMIEEGLPLSLFHHVGCCVSRENLLARKLEISQSFITVEDEDVAQKLGAQVRPAGTYLTLYKQHYIEEKDGVIHNAERAGLETLLEFIDEHNLPITGDYYGVIIGETPAFQCRGREMLLKLEIPID